MATRVYSMAGPRRPAADSTPISRKQYGRGEAVAKAGREYRGKVRRPRQAMRLYHLEQDAIVGDPAVVAPASTSVTVA